MTMSGCSDRSGVASMSGGTDSRSGQEEDVDAQRSSAEAMASCLEDAGFDVARNGTGAKGSSSEVAGYLGVIPVLISDDSAVIDLDNGIGMVTGKYENAEEFARLSAREPVFVEGDSDHTAVYRECLESSGYFVPKRNVDARQEAQFKQDLAEETNRWTKCARKNGYPDLPDAVVRIDGGATYPNVALPADTTDDQLRELFDNCPPVNPKWNEIEDFDPGDDWLTDPMITIDAEPGSSRGLAFAAAIAEAQRRYYPEELTKDWVVP
ncbi:MAG: hypothetical protein LBJ02_07200 [Bifidobacteriaceae bacterium]|nr:hypothetical protein [Bifidobacteriaceae bacterium]